MQVTTPRPCLGRDLSVNLGKKEQDSSAVLDTDDLAFHMGSTLWTLLKSIQDPCPVGLLELEQEWLLGCVRGLIGDSDLSGLAWWLPEVVELLCKCMVDHTAGTFFKKVFETAVGGRLGISKAAVPMSSGFQGFGWSV